MLFAIIFRENLAGTLAKGSILLILISCATPPTTYHAKVKGEGFREVALDQISGVVNFKANAYTKKSEADLYAKFRSIEICHEKGYRFSHVLGVTDKSKSREVLRTSSGGYPSAYYYGMSPYYNRYSTFGVGFSYFDGSSWTETYEYPEVEVTYRCEDVVFEPELILREVTPEEMKLLVKDLRGGLQVEKLLEGSPNKGVLEHGDVLLKVNGARIQKGSELLAVLTQANSKASVDIMREGKKLKVVLKSKDVSESVEKVQRDITTSACKKKNMNKRALCG